MNRLGVIFIALWATIFMPILAFYYVFKLQITDFTGLYENTIYLVLATSLLVSALYIWLLAKYFTKTAYKLMFTSIYIIFFISYYVRICSK